MTPKSIFLCMVVLCIAGGSSVKAPNPADKTLQPAKAIFAARCSLCHSISRPLEKNKTPMEWNGTVSRMQQKAPDRISDADVKEIVSYLNAVRGPKK